MCSDMDALGGRLGWVSSVSLVQPRSSSVCLQHKTVCNSGYAVNAAMLHHPRAVFLLLGGLSSLVRAFVCSSSASSLPTTTRFPVSTRYQTWPALFLSFSLSLSFLSMVFYNTLWPCHLKETRNHRQECTRNCCYLHCPGSCHITDKHPALKHRHARHRRVAEQSRPLYGDVDPISNVHLVMLYLQCLIG